jgi:hypothetical protein
MRLHSDEAPASGPFVSHEVRLLTPGESEVMQGPLPADIVQLRQDWSGPVVLTIGPEAADDELQRAADRLRVPVAELQEFRAMQLR